MQVSLTIVEARGLKDANSHGTSECYCNCWVQGDREDTEFSTAAVDRLDAASWEHQITLPDWVRGQTLEFEVFDQDGTSEHSIGTTALLLSPDLCAANRALEQSLPLKYDGGVQGTLFVTVEGVQDEPQDGDMESEAALQQADVAVVSGAAEAEESEPLAEESQEEDVESEAALQQADVIMAAGAIDGDDRTRCVPGLGLASAGSVSTAEGEELPGSNPEVDALTALLQRKSAGSLLRGWRTYFDPEGAAQVRRQRFVQGCNEVGGRHLAKPVWLALSPDGRSLAFSSFFPKEQARLESLAAIIFPAVGTDLESVWRSLDPQRKNRLCFKDFEKGVSKLGFRCNVKPIFDGIVKGPAFVFKEDLLYLRLFFCGWLQSVPGGVDNTFVDLFSHVRQEPGGPEAFMKRLGLREDEVISELEFAARLSAIGFLGDSVLVAKHLAKREKRVCNGTEIYASSLAALLSDEGHRSSPTPRSHLCETPRTRRSPLTSDPKTSARAGLCETPRTPRSQLTSDPKTSARAGQCETPRSQRETPRTPRSQLASGEPVEWDCGGKDVSLHNKGKHPSLRTYFSQTVREEEEYEDAGRSSRSSSPCPNSARGADGPQHQRPQGMERLQTGQLSRATTCQGMGDDVPGRRRPSVPTCRMLHFEATKLRGGKSGYRAEIGAVVFYRCGEPVRGTSVSRVPHIVSFERPMEVDELRFKTENTDPSLDIVQWHVWGSNDGEVWFDVCDQAEDFPTRHGCVVKQPLVGEEDHDMLRVYVSEATGLKNKASSKHRGVSDPYCTVWIDGKPGTKVHTEVIMSDQRPKWQARTEMRDYKVGNDLRIMVRHSRFGLSTKTSSEDVLLGEARLPSNMFSPHGFDGWVDLEEGNGRVKLNVRPLKEQCVSKVHRLATAKDPLELWLCDTLVL